MRWLTIVALAACEEPAIEEPPPSWVYPPPIASDPLGPLRGRIGRAQAPQPMPPAGVTAELPLHPMRLPTPWQVPGPGRARAVVYGLVDDAAAVELIDIDRGRIAWRDTTACAGPVVGIGAEAVVCADAQGTRAVGLDGKPRWRNDEPFVAMTDDRVVTAGAGIAIVRDAASGDEIARIKLPAGVTADAILASCGDAGRELFAVGQDGKLARIAEAAGGPAVSWATPMGAVLAIDACDGDAIVVTGPGTTGLGLVSVSRATGKITGKLDAVRGYWKARDTADRIEVSTASGVTSYTRDLATGAPVPLPSLGELLATRGERRLVRATPLTAALLDRDGVRAYLPLAAMGAAMGDDSVIAATWLGSPTETVHRFALPPVWRHALRTGPPRAGIPVPAELRDLPDEKPLDLAAAVTRNGTAMYGVAGAAIAGDVLYALTVERAPDDTNGGGVVRLDLATRTWRWQRADGCGPGAPVGIATARDVVVCGARAKHSLVRATSSSGEPRWDWSAANVDAIAAAGDTVLAFDADRLSVLDAADGRLLGSLQSDDAGRVRAALLEAGGATWLATYERGRVVGRLPHVAMVAAWNVGVDGAVSAISPAGAGFLVELDDGDAYWLDARTGAVASVPGVGLAWQGFAEIVAGGVAGGPIPGAIPPLPPRRVLPPPLPAIPAKPRDFEAPPLSTPVQAPPPIGIAWQYTLYDIAGGLRVRNDYAIAPPVVTTPLRGLTGSPLVLRYGTALRRALVVEPLRGNPLARVGLPDEVAAVFTTIVDGRPTAGAVLPGPLRVVLF